MNRYDLRGSMHGFRKTIASAMVFLFFLVGGVVIAPSAGAAPDVSYRQGSDKVAAKLGASLKKNDWDGVADAVKNMGSLIAHLNKKYSDGGKKLDLGKDVEKAISSGNDAKIQEATLRLVYYNIKDLLEVGVASSADGDKGQGAALAKEAFGVYRGCMESQIPKAKFKEGQAVVAAFQKAGQAISSGNKLAGVAVADLDGKILNIWDFKN